MKEYKKGRWGKYELQGEVFGRLTVMEESRKGVWRCECSCGTVTEVLQACLIQAHTSSCGCLKREMVAEKNWVHGMTGTPIYRSWKAMISRCYNQNVKCYGRYGGRGITVCEEWLNSFDQFAQDMGIRPEGTSIDRIDNQLGYFPANCRWATMKEQNNNRRERSSMPPRIKGRFTKAVA